MDYFRKGRSLNISGGRGPHVSDNWDYGADETIDQKTMDDYNSEEFDVGDIDNDYEEIRAAAEAESGEIAEREFAFGDPDKPLQDWEFDSMQLEKHSKGVRARRRQQRKEERAAAKAKAAAEARAEEEARAAEEAKAEAEARAAEEARRAEEEQQAAFERVSRTVKAPIAMSVVGDAQEDETDE